VILCRSTDKGVINEVNEGAKSMNGLDGSADPHVQNEPMGQVKCASSHVNQLWSRGTP